MIMKENITVGIPTYKAKETLDRALASIAIQTERPKVVLGIDDKDDYSEIIARYPMLDIKQVGMEDENGGPGVARQKCLDACDTPFITFMDADDVLFTPFSLAQLLEPFQNQQTVVSQGMFVSKGMSRNDPGHPWVFGRLYNVEYLKANKIRFSKLRAMEDGEFNAKIRMSIEGSPLIWNVVEQPVYLWSEGSEHSITRTGADLELEGKPKGLPLYNYGLCPIGAAICFKSAIDFVKKINPFNPSLMRTATEIFVGEYFQYFETKENAPIYLEQATWVSRWFYWNCFKDYEGLVTEEILNKIALPQYGRLHKLPDKAFNEWLEEIKNSSIPTIDELNEIRYKLPSEVIELETKTGVVGNLLEQFE